jgi:hypothetical protein
MNRILIIIIVVIGGYLAFTSLNSEETSVPVTAKTSLNTQDEIEHIKEAVTEDVYDNKNTTLDGRYLLNITTETSETSQVFDFSSNGSFELSRQMIRPNPEVGGSIEGTYFIQGNTVHLVFPVDRDKKAFPLDTAEMTVISETELKYGNSIAVLD